MEEKFWSSVRLCLMLSLVAYAWLVKQENKEYVKALNAADAGYFEFTQKKVGGKKLLDFIDQDSAGVFMAGDVKIACARITTPLPALLRK